MQLGFFKSNWFLVGMLTAIAIAFGFPKIGEAINPQNLTNSISVVIIFLLTGFVLPSKEIVKGVRDIKLHFFLQIFIFIVIPLYFFCTAFPFKPIMNGYLVIGFYGLACLPTTISTCVVFTQMTGGNVVGTIFNSSLANLIGIILSPLILTFLVSSLGGVFPLNEILLILMNLVLQILLPFAAGQIFQLSFKQFAGRHKEKLNVLSSVFVLVMILLTFSKAAGNPRLSEEGLKLVWPFVYLALSNVVFVLLAYVGARFFRFSQDNIISVLFTAPQKTLGMGIPLLSTFFAKNPEILSVAVLPLLFYHPWQLMVAGMVKYSRLVKGR